MKIAVLVLCFISTTVNAAQLTFACREDNDVYQIVKSSGRYDVKRFDDPAAAIKAARDGGGVLILADGYPTTRTVLPPATHRRLYIEFPELPASEIKTTQWERGVIADPHPTPGQSAAASRVPHFFGEQLPPMRILALNDCHYVTTDSKSPPLMVIARVAGYDQAVYGLPPTAAPLLYQHDDQTLIATTKLSNFITARHAPAAEWRTIWRRILHHLDPQTDPPPLNVEPIARPAYGKSDKLPPDIERATFNRAAAFYLNSRLILTPQRKEQIRALLLKGQETIAPPPTDEAGDGSHGMIEGYASQILHDGSQLQRTPIRSDCNAEAAMVLALAGDEKSRKTSANLLDYTFGPEMQSMGRLDPKHPAFGLTAWGAISNAWMVANYGDDDARVILSGVVASATMQTNRWDDHLLRALYANLRTTGKLGFRGDRIDIPQLEQHGWKHFHDADTINLAPHFEAALWTCYLWAHARTGEKEFLDKTLPAIRMTMDAYAKKQWRWMDNMERSRMLWCLAWLVRVQDTPEHRQWLVTIANALLAAQDPCGAIQERLGGTGGGHYQVPQSNEAYGTTETPLIQKNGDPVTDQLYATGFALIALHEAAAATGDAKLRDAEDKLATYLCRIQVRSEKIPYLDGAWFRAFDYEKWDFWASSADLGWGAWSVEAGWGPAWIATTLSLRDRKTNLWDLTASSKIKDQLPKVQSLMSQNTGRPLR